MDASSPAGRVSVVRACSPRQRGGRARRGEVMREASCRAARTGSVVNRPCCSTVVTTAAVEQPCVSAGRPSVQRGSAAAEAGYRRPRVPNVPSGTRVAGARHVVLAQLVLGLSHLVALRGHGLCGRSLGESVRPVPGLCDGAPLRLSRCELSRHRKRSLSMEHRTSSRSDHRHSPCTSRERARHEQVLSKPHDASLHSALHGCSRTALLSGDQPVQPPTDGEPVAFPSRCKGSQVVEIGSRYESRVLDR